MTLKKYLLSILIITSLVWLIFVFISFAIDPQNTNWIGFVFFYFSLFLALSGTITIVGFTIRKKMSKKGLMFYVVKTSFRQSFLFSFLIIATLFMLAENLFSWLNIITLIIILSITEYILINEAK